MPLNYESLAVSRQELREKAVKLLGNSCTKCNYSYYPQLLTIECLNVVSKQNQATEWGKLRLIISNFNEARSRYILLCPTHAGELRIEKHAGAYSPWDEELEYVKWKLTKGK